jgi:SAM-dependent methyltransferase
MRAQPDVDYTSFDLAPFAMEQHDITAMRYPTDSIDYFICFHVLEHLPHDAPAVAEIHRVLRPGGTAVLQVPIDWEAEKTREYPAPDPRECGHVRRYGRDFAEKLAAPDPVIAVVAAKDVDASAAGAAMDVIRQVEVVLGALSAAPVPELRSGGLGVREAKRLAYLALGRSSP